jgi:hypothetical protein
VLLGWPALPVGTFGKMGFAKQPSGEIQARARFRDYDGRTRLVSKIARSRAAAERALKAELPSRQAPASAATRLDVLAEVSRHRVPDRGGTRAATRRQR